MSFAAELARLLAYNAEAVCRYYLSNGHRSGHYSIVGDVVNTSGRSLYVRLSGPPSGKGAVGKWSDAATGQHGDLLDLIALSCGYDRLTDVFVEARSNCRIQSLSEHQGQSQRQVYHQVSAGCWRRPIPSQAPSPRRRNK